MYYFRHLCVKTRIRIPVQHDLGCNPFSGHLEVLFLTGFLELDVSARITGIAWEHVRDAESLE